MRQTRTILIMLLLAIGMTASVAFAATSGPSPIPNPPNFQVSTSALVLCKGVVNYIPITVSNLGNPSTAGNITMDSVLIGLSGSKYLSVAANGTTPSINIAAGTSYTYNTPIFVSLNATTFISAGIAINYNYLNYYSDSEVRNVSFGTESCPSQLSASITPKVLVSGKIENVSFTLTNNGSSTLRDLSFKASLSPQQGQILSTQPILISAIPGFSHSVINETLFINSTSETFPINASISFYNGTNINQVLDSIDVLSSGIINLTATSTTLSPAAPTVGSIFSISFVLTNLGTTSASAVTATALPPSGITTFGSNSVFIGSIGVNTQTPVTLTLTSTSSTKSGSYEVPIEITYLNNLRQQINMTIKVPVDLEGSAFGSNGIRSGEGGVVVTSGNGTTVYKRSGGSGGLILAILIIIVIALVLLYLRERGLHKRTRESMASGRKSG